MLADLPDTPSTPLFPPAVVQKARLLKKLWAIVQLDVQWRDDFLRIHGRHAVLAREQFSEGVEFWFRLLKQLFSDFYRECKPLEQDMGADSAVRAISGQMLMYLGDLCKFRTRLEEGEMRSESGAGVKK